VVELICFDSVMIYLFRKETIFAVRHPQLTERPGLFCFAVSTKKIN
jgi:hypothetical protein